MYSHLFCDCFIREYNQVGSYILTYELHQIKLHLNTVYPENFALHNFHGFQGYLSYCEILSRENLGSTSIIR